ncbi:MAG: hypothetical protein EAY81_03140 [Bacteroidetes bacterium]|nr:MAG: hypothetical protein EAY81_03140 [Bacteroidota bacterium]
MRTYITVFLFLVSVLRVAAQQQDEQLAAQYMSNNEFGKAVDVYERLYSKGNKSTFLYENLLTCYFKLNRYEDAEKLVKKQQRKFENNAYYLVDLGYVYERANDPVKAKKAYEQVLTKLNPSYDAIMELAGAYKKRNLTEYAIKTFIKGRNINKNDYLFCIELAQLYGDISEVALMFQEYLSAINQNPELMSDVQGYLQLYLDKDADYEVLKQTLIKRLKDFPANEYYTEMLTWLYVQRKDFDSALVLAKASDKRNKEQGRRIIDLSELAIANQRYDAAVKGFNDVIMMGSDKPFYINAKLGILRARGQKIFSSANYTPADLTLLEQDYHTFLKEFGKYPFTAQTQRELAQLQAYYLFKYDEAIENYKELCNMPRLDNKFKAECKLDLGDIYVLKGEEWEAMLLYGQVDKEFLEDPLGQEAKFRNAKLSFYLNEFDWARAQLDVLKTATTQLIANNAIELSLQIQDNTIDSNEEPLKLFAHADLLFFQNRLLDAKITLDSIDRIYPKHALADDVLFKKGEIALKEKNFSLANSLFEQVFKEHGSGILGDNALFILADLAQNKLNNQDLAKKYLEQFIETYPGSFFLTEVRKRYRLLRGDNPD